MAEYVVADTTVVIRLSRASEDSRAYEQMMGDRWLAVSFQTPPELWDGPFGESRRQRLQDYLATMAVLPNTEATGVWYSRVAEKRRDLRKKRQPGADASDADVWIVSSALEHRLPLLSHDKQQVELGRAAGLRVLTNLPGLRDDNPPLG